jgi:hypothetical protein
MLLLRRPERPVWALLTLAGLADLVVLWRRFSSLFGCWHWEGTEGREGPGIYAIWRLLHGYPLYEWPNRPPYTLTLYNFGFYHFYAAVMRVFGVNDEGLLVAPRVLTLVAALLGCALFARLAWSLAPVRGLPGKFAFGALCASVWFGTQLLAWWPFAIRPDLLALVVSLAGVGLVLRALESASTARFVGASLVFFAAWCLKQSAVLSFLGSLAAVLVLTRRPRWLVALALPFAGLAGLCLLLGGERYRLALLVAPALSRFRPALLFEVTLRALPQNLWMFGFAPIVFVLEARDGILGAWQRRSVAERALLVIGAVAVAFGILGLGREGANKNYLFDGYVVSALASWVTLVRLLDEARPARGLLALAAALLVPWTLFPLAQLLQPNRFGRTELCNESNPAPLVALSDTVTRLPKPLYADHDVFSQPWRSTDDRYPAVVLDGGWHGIAMREGFIPHGFLDAWLAQQHYASALVPDGTPLVASWRARGIPCSAFPELVQGLQYVTCRLPYAATAPLKR